MELDKTLDKTLVKEGKLNFKKDNLFESFVLTDDGVVDHYKGSYNDNGDTLSNSLFESFPFSKLKLNRVTSLTLKEGYILDDEEDLTSNFSEEIDKLFDAYKDIARDTYELKWNSANTEERKELARSVISEFVSKHPEVKEVAKEFADKLEDENYSTDKEEFVKLFKIEEASTEEIEQTTEQIKDQIEQVDQAQELKDELDAKMDKLVNESEVKEEAKLDGVLTDIPDELLEPTPEIKLTDKDWENYYNKCKQDYTNVFNGDSTTKIIFLKNKARSLGLDNLEFDENSWEEDIDTLAKAYADSKVKKVEEARVHMQLQKGDKFVNQNGVVAEIIDVDKEHLLDGEPQVTRKLGDKDIKCYKMSSVVDMLNQNNYKKIEESKKTDEEEIKPQEVEIESFTSNDFSKRSLSQEDLDNIDTLIKKELDDKQKKYIEDNVCDIDTFILSFREILKDVIDIGAEMSLDNYIASFNQIKDR